MHSIAEMRYNLFVFRNACISCKCLIGEIVILYLAGFSCHNSVLLNVIVTVNKSHVSESLGKILHELAKFHKICYDEGQADETRDTT